MNYGLIFGRKPAISYAEFRAVARRERFPVSDVVPFVQGVLWQGGDPEQTKRVFDQLGGAIKVFEIIQHVAIKSSIAKTIVAALTPRLLEHHHPDPARPIKFGVSLVPLTHPNPPFRLMKTLLPHFVQLRKALPKSKWISSKDASLSSVIITKEKLLERGVELNLLFDEHTLWITKTLGVQDFKSFSDRDYGRPRRDDRSGMLPPKLARILLNLSGLEKNATLLDPHCGSGTILQEALMLGFLKITGSDISPQAIADSDQNIKWLTSRYHLSSRPNLRCCDATKLRVCFPARSFSGIITEPYLGPSQASQRKNLARVAHSLSKLYLQTFQSYQDLLTSPSLVISVFPIFIQENKRISLDILPQLEKLGFRLIRPELPSCYERTDRGTLIYGRPQQAVEREITIWRYTEKWK